MTNASSCVIINTESERKREVIKMRTISYAVVDTDTNKRYSTGTERRWAEEKLAELKAENPNGNYIITYRWGNI